MKPKYKSKMCQKQRKRARANEAESKESNKPKTTSAERMRKIRERRKAETSGVASEPGVASTSRAAPFLNIAARNLFSILNSVVSHFTDQIPLINSCFLEGSKHNSITTRRNE
jgi:hypothetical protein